RLALTETGFNEFALLIPKKWACTTGNAFSCSTPDLPLSPQICLSASPIQQTGSAHLKSDEVVSLLLYSS
ncbi:hypothetical protein, partial [Komagataeibacter xylinus]|uniref:hypothetical protein n=1 Tax=Komagataeibacter xylinus TaxID=28448 RepID=UPI0039EA5CB7